MSHHPYTNISQRAVSSYSQLLSLFQPKEIEGSFSVNMEAQRELHTFFLDLYQNIYTQSKEFGLSSNPDLFITDNEQDLKEKKQEVKRALDRPKKMIQAGLDFLMLVGQHGVLKDNLLSVERYADMVRQSGVHKNFLAGFRTIGLTINSSEDQASLTHQRYTNMMAALQAMAKCCNEYPDKLTGKYLFTTCDFRAFFGYKPQPEDLYRAFDGFEAEVVNELHSYFWDLNFKPEVTIHAPYAWNVKYQGDRKIKATPLFQIDYDDRHLRPLRMQIKCASTNRLADVLPLQPQLLQDDFHKRSFDCQGTKCNWCRNQKTLGPSVVSYNGEERTVCWYAWSDISPLDENTVELVEQYERMHANLPVLV